LAMPPIRNAPCRVVTVTACSFGNGSVVMMARAASSALAARERPNRGADARHHFVHFQPDADDAR
jgi:hypothetical protein